MAATWLGVLLLGVVLISDATGLYVFRGDPYNASGTLPATSMVLEVDRGVPMRTAVYYPNVTGEYSFLFFFGGLYALIPAEYYTSVLTSIASHGYVVAGVDIIQPFPFIPPAGGVKSIDYNDIIKNLDWLKLYLQSSIAAVQRGKNISISWNNFGLLCHSAGCDDSIEMILQKSVTPMAAVYWGPFSKRVTTNFTGYAPSLFYGTKYSEEGPVPCAIPGFDYKHLYSYWSKPKVLLENDNYGHCAVLDQNFWDICQIVHACKDEHHDSLDTYHRFMQGYASAFFGAYIQGNQQMLSYVLNKTLIFIPVVQLQYEL